MERNVDLVLGNEAIGLALVEQESRIVTGYPGTPSSEILASVNKYKVWLDRQVYTEWSTNEKVAFEVALAAAWTGVRAAVSMKQVGLNVAADPLFSAAYTGVKGGFLLISADDPGPYSSQTEQDSRLIALAAKVPVLDPSTPLEAYQMVAEGFLLSEKYGLPIMLRPTTRLCHALQSMALERKMKGASQTQRVRFKKDPARWSATPKYRHLLHKELNAKLIELALEFTTSSMNSVLHPDSSDKVGIIASGVAALTAVQALDQMNVNVPVLKLGTPFPLPARLVREFLDRVEMAVVIEEPDACIELQISDRNKVKGKLDGTVPSAGELTPEIVFSVLSRVFTQAGLSVPESPEDEELTAFVKALPLPARKPRLCPGCGHRSAFFAMKRTFGPQAIYPGDIGCYTLGTNLRAVDTLVDMGASISMAHGFFQTNRVLGNKQPVIATIGDSTFLHSGIPPLINAVHTGARFVLVILDNHTTAMTGFQPTAANDMLADGSDAAHRVSLAELARACGAKFVVETDPYENKTFSEVLKKAYEHSQSDEGGVAVVIANRPCVLYDPEPLRENPLPVIITEECDGCRYCLEAFECPALVLSSDRSRVDVNHAVCVDCGQCIDACYKGFIVPELSDLRTDIMSKEKIEV